MPSVVVVGAQWGDEGKGKITDFLAARADLVVRYQGGSNAGHTVVVNNRTFKLHLIPSGAIHPNTTCIVGNGVVVDPIVMAQELADLAALGVHNIDLLISERAHVIMPYHRLLDKLEEEKRGAGRIGTTGRGIGPAYVDKAARCGVRMSDMSSCEVLHDRLQQLLPAKNELLRALYGHNGFTADEIVDQYAPALETLAPAIADTSVVIYERLAKGERVLFEGAQGTLLDLDHGTYPYVTSSSATAGGAAVGSGVGPQALHCVLGVTKAYTTRVGEGPFPSELNDEVGESIRQLGAEFGTTTGRPRRCGWFDAVVGRYAVRINGLQQLAVMKLDVLSGLQEVKICTGYQYQDRVIKDFPARLDVLSECQPIYEVMAGWQEDITGARNLDELPAAARAYILRLEELVGAKVNIISVGPGREQTIIQQELFLV